MSVQDITIAEHEFIYETVMLIRGTEVDVGQCLTSEALISLLAEVRMRFFHSKRIKDVNTDFQGLIVTDLALNMPNRVFKGEKLMFEIGISEINRKKCVVHYRISRLDDFSLVGKASVVLANYDYKTKKIVPITSYFIDTLEQKPFEI